MTKYGLGSSRYRTCIRKKSAGFPLHSINSADINAIRKIYVFFMISLFSIITSLLIILKEKFLFPMPL